MDNVDDQLRAELAELEALEAAVERGEPLPEPENHVQPPPEGWFPCPCCGHQMFAELGGYEICSVCFWEDDLVQMRWPSMGWGANAVSLIQAQQNHQRFGAMEERFRNMVRPPKDDEPLDPGWRPIDLTRDSFEEPGSSASWPDDQTALYWWRPTFWRRNQRPTAEPGQPDS
ncbi:CPCC family cysteine-rich protein [Streptomyces sp. WMMB303]|uniref:CPCC family cysteine-rich protein n=1 Tax=Streptomyces sp. WMMB303 TaxID=3034154 RepID=UPI0023EC2A4E|nr:CPCC family cysteine-rich protein [Streptomyces sp. WMMB303]MDF4251839.1 CPCC family cysteine-rich protein [Streptomyces sp. WMMB303]MDF4254531.1 CPCC family cysteine-rich protein [Streptomyces sp. WMMB303]